MCDKCVRHANCEHARDPSQRPQHTHKARRLGSFALPLLGQLRDGFDSHPGEQSCCSSLVLCVFICLSSSLCHGHSLPLRIAVIDSHSASVGLSCYTASPHNHTRGSLFVSVYLPACLCFWAFVCFVHVRFLQLPAESTAAVDLGLFSGYVHVCSANRPLG